MDQKVTVAILGAGISGLCMAIRLKAKGIESFALFEKADRVGGTWRENTYPGVACDIPSHLYSYSFAPNPNWSRVFSPGDEIQQYCEHTAESEGILPHIQFGAEVQQVIHQDGCWLIKLTDGRSFTADFVVSALGALHIPFTPKFEGIDQYKGELFHSARWDHDCDLSGKRVAVIGSGATAIQIVPAIATTVEHLTVFQRNPAWIVRRRDKPYSNSTQKWIRRIPLIQRLWRWFFYWVLEARGRFMRKGSRVGKYLEKRAREHMRRHIHDPDMLDQLTPNYTIGCKRILLSDDYYATLSRTNVALVTNPIAQFTETGIQCQDGTEHSFDVVISATGFRPLDVTGFIDVVGPGNQRLSDKWDDRIEAHRTVMVSGFPNFFFLLGPNSGLGHNSVILMIEAQVEYVLECLSLLDRHGKRQIEPLPESMDAYQEHLDSGMRRTVFAGGCNAWYTDDNDKNFTLWPYSTAKFFWEMRKPQAKEYLIRN